MANTIVQIPDHEEITLPQGGLSVEEVRRALQPLGFAGLGTAQATSEVNLDGDTVISFSRPRGGEKGTAS